MKFFTRKLVTHENLNPRGYLHGGELLKWIDEEGGIHAGIEMNTSLIVTKMMSEINFKYPVILRSKHFPILISLFIFFF